MLTVSLVYTLNVQVPPEDQVHLKKKKKIQIVPFSLQKVKFLQDKCKTKSVSVSTSISTYLSIFLSPKSLQTVTAAMKSEDDCFLAGKRRQT